MAIDPRSDKLNKKLGRKGEHQAVRYLKKRGYKILERGYKNPFGEVDIIALKEDTIAFIEVKTRLNENYGLPNEAVNESKKRRYIQAAKYYFMGTGMDCVVRFDVIEILCGRINHIVNAFTVGG